MSTSVTKKVGVILSMVSIQQSKGASAAFSHLGVRSHFGKNQSSIYPNTKVGPLSMYDNLDSAESFPEGLDLAKSFNEELKIRQFRNKLNELDPEDRLLTDNNWTGSEQNRGSFPNSRNPRDDIKLPLFSKVNDSDEDFDPKPGFFREGKMGNLFNTNRNNDADHPNGSNSVKDNMMRREFNLINRATSTTSYLLQAGIILVTLAFYLFIGFTGGITDGSERFVDGSTTDFSFADDFDINSVFKNGGEEIELKSTDGPVWL